MWQYLPHSCLPRAHHSCISNPKYYICNECKHKYFYQRNLLKSFYQYQETDQQDIYSLHLNMARSLVIYSAILLVKQNWAQITMSRWLYCNYSITTLKWLKLIKSDKGHDTIPSKSTFHHQEHEKASRLQCRSYKWHLKKQLC